MKALSSVQQKQQATVMAAVTALEQQAAQRFTGFLQAWFSLEYNVFPSSLLVRLQFVDEAALALAQPSLALWQQRLSAMLVKRGVLLKQPHRHLVFTTEGPNA